MVNIDPVKPSFEDYIDWYKKRFDDDLDGGRPEQWYETVTDAALRRLERSEFWKQLHDHLSDWNDDYFLAHDGYSLLEAPSQSIQIQKKSYESAINKSFRWNVRDNKKWPNPPREPSKAPAESHECGCQDPDRWFGPHNWLDEFPDIFRTRLTTKYFDGVPFLAAKIKKLAECTAECTSVASPVLRLRAFHDGYHAAHLWIYYQLETFDYLNRDPFTARVRLEIQVATMMQDAISNLLHDEYEKRRIFGQPTDWEWDYLSPTFSANYLGSTLHYLEGMIVMARDRRRIENVR